VARRRAGGGWDRRGGAVRRCFDDNNAWEEDRHGGENDWGDPFFLGITMFGGISLITKLCFRWFVLYKAFFLLYISP
jgi:hypothetical protein